MRDPSWMEPDALPKKKPSAAPVTWTEEGPADVDRVYPYLGAWREYKRIWRAIWINGFVGWLVIAGLTFLLPRIGAEWVLAVLFPIWALVWFVGTGIAVLRMISFRCPRCNEPFFTFGRSPAFQLKCQACGLRKFAVNDAGKGLHQVKPPKD